MDNWMREYDELVGLADAVPDLVRACKAAPDDAQARAQLNRKTQQFTTRCQMLEEDLEEMSRKPIVYHVTESEINRRRGLLHALKQKIGQWKAVLQAQGGLEGLTSDREELLAGGGRVWGGKETARTKELDNQQVLQQQKDDMLAQDQRLNILGESIMRTQDIARGIGGEINDHVDLLDRMDTRIDKTSANVFRGTRQTDGLTRKRSTCSLWIVIFVLFAIIVVLGLLPFVGP